MPEPTSLLLWTDNAALYAEAIAAAGLAPRVRIDGLARKETPSAIQLAETEAMFAWSAPPGMLPRMPKLRWVQAPTAGVDGWLALPDLPSGLALTCARGTHGDAMPENILGALFHVAKDYAAIAEAQKESRWVRRVPKPLNGSTLGILGLGVIGQEVARLATALRMKVVGTRRNPTPMPFVSEVLPPERTDEVLAQADYVLLLLPSTLQTNNSIDAKRLAHMKPGAWLINFGRGSAIVDGDLIAAVKAGTIAGAVLDVFREEPLPQSHPFWTTEGIVVLPHIGGMHPERDRVVARLMTENLRLFLDGKPLLNVVDRVAGY